MTSEAELVSKFLTVLVAGKSCWRSLEVTTEWRHSAGLVDVLVRNKKRDIIAFEAKLADWKSAFHQAYRNSAYADRAYVLMPHETVHRALAFRHEFEFRGIGLCSYRAGKVFVHIKAKKQDELLSWEKRRAHAYFDGIKNGKGKINQSGSRILSSKEFAACT